MDWREFFKPDKRKILVFLAIPVIVLTGVFVAGNMDSTSPLGLALGTFFSIILFIGILSIGIFFTIFKALGMDPFPDVATGSYAEILEEVVLVLFVIFWLYFVSCTLVSAYNSLKIKNINMRPYVLPLIISLAAVVLLSGYFQQAPKIKMDFSSSQLDYKPENFGVQKMDWLDDTTLQVKGYILLNCAAIIQDSGYTISGNKIKLIPAFSYIRDPEKEETCLNAHELVYKFSNLERKNYEIIFDEGS